MGLLTLTIDHAAPVYASVCAQLALLSKYVHLKVKIIHDLQGKQYLCIFPFSFFFTSLFLSEASLVHQQDERKNCYTCVKFPLGK